MVLPTENSRDLEHTMKVLSRPAGSCCYQGWGWGQEGGWESPSSGPSFWQEGSLALGLCQGLPLGTSLLSFMV